MKPAHNKHTMKKKLLFVGLDVHAQNIGIALAEGAGGEARTYGTIPNDLHALEKVFARLRKAHPGTELRVCYEAGPTGFVLARRLAQLKIHCTVVAPSLIPSRSGDRIKMDRRDALKLARLHRAGELTAVHVPEPWLKRDVVPPELLTALVAAEDKRFWKRAWGVDVWALLRAIAGAGDRGKLALDARSP